MQKIEKKQALDYKIRGILSMVAKPLLLVVVSFLLAGCCPTTGLLPFSVAIVGVLWDRKETYASVALGACLAALVREFSLYSFALYCIPVLLMLFAVNFFRVKKLESVWWRIGALTLCSVIGILCTSGILAYDIIMALLSCAGGCALLPILGGAVQALESAGKRSTFSRSELACMAVLLSGILLSFPDNAILGISPMLLLALACISVVSLALPTGEAIAFASLCAMLFLLKGTSLAAGFVLVTAALLAGFFKELGKFSALLGFVVADVLLTLCLQKDLMLILPLQTVMLAAVPPLLLSKKQLHALRGLGGTVLVPTASEKELAARSIAEIEMRLTSAADVYNRLSQIFESTKENKRAKRLSLCATASSKVCSACSKYDYCWKMRYSDTYSDFKELAGMVCDVGSLSPYDVSKDFKARCIDWIGVLLCMNTQAGETQEVVAESGNVMMAKQCRSIADMLKSLAKGGSEVEYDADAERRITDLLCEKGFVARDVVCRNSGGHLRGVTITLHSCKGEKHCMNVIPALLKEACGCDFVCDMRSCSLSGNRCSCAFVPAPKLKASCHAACKIKDGETVCGDSFSLLPLPGGKYLAAISDGMGSGNEAAAESENAMALLETLFVGRMEPRQAYDTVNELLQLRKKNNESYSTMDVCVLDLFDGICSWGKIGAVPGYVVRSGRVQPVFGNALPLGIVSKPEPSITDRIIKEGDLLLLMSDGVYDALVTSQEDGIASLLEGMEEKDVRLVAATMVRSAIHKNGGQVRDDMTVIAIRIDAA